MTDPNDLRELVLVELRRRRAQDPAAGHDAAAIAADLGGRYGGRSVAGALGALERMRLVELVRRTDGRSRPLLYRAAER